MQTLLMQGAKIPVTQVSLRLFRDVCEASKSYSPTRLQSSRKISPEIVSILPTQSISKRWKDLLRQRKEGRISGQVISCKMKRRTNLTLLRKLKAVILRVSSISDGPWPTKHIDRTTIAIIISLKQLQRPDHWNSVRLLQRMPVFSHSKNS